MERFSSFYLPTLPTSIDLALFNLAPSLTPQMLVVIPYLVDRLGLLRLFFLGGIDNVYYKYFFVQLPSCSCIVPFFLFFSM